MAIIDTVYTPNIFGLTSFPLKHNGYSVFYKEFNPSDNNIVDIVNDTITIPNHFFKTGEPLSYNVPYEGSEIQISPTSSGANGTITKFPSVVYVVVVDENKIRIALSQLLASQNLYVDIIALGIEDLHTFSAFKQNSKCIISIDNIIQSPISIGNAFGIVETNPRNISEIVVDSLIDIKINSILKIGVEYALVNSINYSNNKIRLTRNFLGSPYNTYTNIPLGYIVEGNYNIVDDIIYFTSAPFDGIISTAKIEPENLVFGEVGISSYSFNLLDNNLENSLKVLLESGNPPPPLVSGESYYIIKNFEGSYSFSSSYINSKSIPPVKIEFQNSSNETPLTDINLVFKNSQYDLGSRFQGRVFLKSNYDGNFVADDISATFDGTKSSFEIKNLGAPTTGIKADNGILLINNIFQYPEFEDSFEYRESLDSINTDIIFTGNKYPNTNIGLIATKSYDVNVGGFPRGGIIVGYGLSNGINYKPLTSYSNIPLSGSLTGIGASVSFEINSQGIVSKFGFTNPGYGYSVGEKLYPTGIVGTSNFVDDNKLIVSIEEVYKDSFSAWNIGRLQKLDDMTLEVNGKRKIFEIKETINGVSNLLSLESVVGSDINLAYNLLIFVNDILQIPEVSYKFQGGTQIEFMEAIPNGSTLKVYFYRGYGNDSSLENIVADIKEGDNLIIDKDLIDRVPELQYKRTVKKILSSDKLETDIYERKGVSKDSSQSRSINWIPQKADLLISGEYVSKSRRSHDANVGIFTGISISNATFIGVSTDIVGINTLAGIIPYKGINLGDYIESNYTGIGVTVTFISEGSIKLSKPSTSPSGTNTISASVIRKL